MLSGVLILLVSRRGIKYGAPCKGHRKFTDPLMVTERLGVGTRVLSDGKTWNALHLTAFPCMPTTPAENSAHYTRAHTTRPKRYVRKPSWLKDCHLNG